MLPSMKLDDHTKKMIFRIEQLLPTEKSEKANTVKHEPISHDDAGIYVAQFTPKDTYSEIVPSITLTSTPGNEQVSSKSAITTAGLLRMTPGAMRKIRLSEDINSYNALFEQHNGHIRIHVIRDIGRDEEIVAWIELELTLLMGIPFLTPLNIQGNNCYTCHLCGLTFETPHPLKIHLSLDCGRSPMDTLWQRLHYAVASKPSTTPENFSTRHDTSSTFLVSSSNSPQPGVTSITDSQLSRLSAFKPITSHAISFMPRLTSSLSNLPTLSPLPSIASSSMNPAAQIEAIVSNMGASKQGHLCIYCGKVYSRKYGLKIHIRTHTGFKPLKCKFCLRPFGDPSNLNKHVRLHMQSHGSSSNVGSGGKGFQ